MVTWVAALCGLDPIDAYQFVTQAVESPLANVCDTNNTSIAKMPKRYIVLGGKRVPRQVRAGMLLRRHGDLPRAWRGRGRARYQGISLGEAEMTDMLIRDVPDDVVAALEAHARRLGLSRSEYVRRRLAQDVGASDFPVTTADLARFADAFCDLADPDVMARAWQWPVG